MHNRIEDSSNLLTASSQSEYGIRQNPFIYYVYLTQQKLIKFSFLQLQRAGTPEYQASLVLDTLLNIKRLKND